MSIVTEKRCTRCGEIKPSSEFSKNLDTKDRLHRYCKRCVSKYPERYDYAKQGLRKCSQCGMVKSVSEFSFYSYKTRFGNPSRKYSDECMDCHNKRSQQYYAENSERINSKHKAYREKNKEAASLQKKKYRAEHAEQETARRKRYYREHVDDYRRQAKERRKTNRERRVTFNEFRQVWNANIRAKFLGAEGTLTVEEWQDRKEKDGNRCLKCGSEKYLTPDHVVPLCVGGTNCIDNIQTLCFHCNAGKQKNVVDYRL